MIEEIIEKVREAERQAGEEKERAIKSAEEIKISADKRAAEILSSAKKNAKAERSNAITAAEMRAEEEYAERIGEAKKRGNALKLALDGKVEELAAKICGEIISGGGN